MFWEKELKSIVEKTISQLWPDIDKAVVRFTIPKQQDHGDATTNVAFLLSKEIQQSPRQIADQMVAKMDLKKYRWLSKAEVAGAGFVNFFMTPTAFFEFLPEISKKGGRYGEGDYGNSQKVVLEFVSANPTGPLNIVSARAAAFGDVLANLLEKVNYKVCREFYINDVGNQIELFAKSIEARYLQALGEEAAVPAEGYQGEYLKTLAAGLVEKSKKKKYSLDDFREYGLKAMIAAQQRSLKNFGVTFDRWFRQSSLFPKPIEKSLHQLEKRGHLYENEGALFFRSTTFGDDKDRVVKKQDGEYSYFASDIAYHADKLGRAGWIIDIFGPDHHGYLGRTKAVVRALGYKPEQLTVLIVQQVNLLENQIQVKMSKRAGKLVTMDELLEEVGKDVARYFFLQRSANTHLDFDLELAKKETAENPVFYIQYAYARIAGIFAKAKEEGIPTGFKGSELKLELLHLPEEKEIAKKLLGFPGVLEQAAREMAPHHLAFYLLELAQQFQAYYSQAKHNPDYRVINAANPNVTRMKLYLLNNIKIVLQNALTILGISAPERMDSKDVASPLQ